MKFILMTLLFPLQLYPQNRTEIIDYIKQNIVAYSVNSDNTNTVYMAYEPRYVDLPELFGFTAPDTVVKYTMIINQGLIRLGHLALVNHIFDVRGISNIITTEDRGYTHLKIFIKDGYLAKETDMFDKEDGYVNQPLSNGMIDIPLSSQCDFQTLRSVFYRLSKMYNPNEVIAPSFQNEIIGATADCPAGQCNYVYPNGVRCKFCRFTGYDYCAKHFK